MQAEGSLVLAEIWTSLEGKIRPVEVDILRRLVLKAVQRYPENRVVQENSKKALKVLHVSEYVGGRAAKDREMDVGSLAVVIPCNSRYTLAGNHILVIDDKESGEGSHRTLIELLSGGVQSTSARGILRVQWPQIAVVEVSSLVGSYTGRGGSMGFLGSTAARCLGA